MNADAWNAFHRRWSRLQPPLRAAPEAVAAIGRAIEGFDDEVLLLGVTPELAGIGRRLTAVDWSESMIGHIWPGDGPDRTALLADWRGLPMHGPKYSAVIGDGSFNCLTLADAAVVFGQLAGVLAAPARLAVRAYLTPTPCETLADVRAAALAREAGGFHGFKWRLAMAHAAETRSPEVVLAEVHDRFEALFPDRARLAEATGWSAETIAEIDAYAGSDTVYLFPTADELLGALRPAFANPRLEYSGPYDLAERCPILVADFAP